MKLRDSGMPAEDYWESLFNVGLVLDRLGVGAHFGNVAEVGCGYGTFTIPAARRIRGTVYAVDIEPEMVTHTSERAALASVTNVVCEQRDLITEGFGISPGSMDAILLFNILHCESPNVLLELAVDALRIGGFVLVIHWRCDTETPRGPSLAIRPKPEQIVAWAHATGQLAVEGGPLDLPPWHFGLRFRRV